MSTSKKTLRNAVSFTNFRRMQYLAVSNMWSAFVTCDDASDDAKLLAWAMMVALREARYADAVALSRTLSEQQYGDARTFRLGAQIVALVKKVPFEDPSLDPDGVAQTKFLQSEVDCGETNKVFRDLNTFYSGSIPKGHVFTVDEEALEITSLLDRARRHVRRVLGSKPPTHLIYPNCRYGKGSNVGVHGDLTHLLRKLSVEKWTVSPLALPHALASAASTPAFWYALGLDPQSAAHLWAEPMAFYSANGCFTAPNQQEVMAEFRRRFMARVELCDYDLIAYVPKDADSSRTVGTQPLLNVLCQLPIGDYLRDLLLARCDIDLREDQKGRNGPLALLGSACEGTTFSTLDLKAASDTIATQLCKWLLPEAWFRLLNDVRTPSYRFTGDETSVRYEKFCAMGNGFCFPLESLIFWALSQAVYDVVDLPDRQMAIYGDDIIVYQPAALLLIELLNASGFEVNTSKTFVFGPFRESCGQDYFNGINVRPVVLDEVIQHESQAYHLINSLQRKGFTALAEQMRRLLPDGALKRPFPGTTTTALEVPWDEFMASRHARFQKVPRNPETPYYCSWQWLEFCATAVPDKTEYSESLHLTAILAGAASVNYVPAFSHRRKTAVRVRMVAHG